MRQLVNLVCGLIFMAMLTFGLRFIFGRVGHFITDGGIRGMVLWQTDWDDAIAQAQAKNKRVLVEFASESSNACHDLAKKSWTRMDIVNAASDYVPVLVYVDEHPELVKQYDIGPLPSLIVIDAHSKEILKDARGETFAPDDLLLWLKPDAQLPTKWNTSFPQSTSIDSQSMFQTQQSPFSH